MRALRERLRTLSTPRTRSSPSPSPGGPRAGSSAASAAGHSRSEAQIPLDARQWLPQLPAANPQLAALLAPEAPAKIPPVADWLFLDLETTGIAGGTGTYAFLIGIGQLCGDGFRLRQYFLRDLGSERALLAELLPRLRQASLLVTYNGKLFDAPLLDTRLRLSRMALPFHGVFHLDLLYPARQLWKLRWGSVRLLDLERTVLDYQRPTDVPGERIPQLYFDYLRSGNQQGLEAVFRHNRADLVSLAALTARLLHLLAQPETACEPLELYALARLFERRRAAERARRLYQQGLGGSLPIEVRRAALFRLSLLHKRHRSYQQALALWRQLLERHHSEPSEQTVAICEELAVCYEHRIRNLDAARESTERALAELDRLCLQEPQQRRRYRDAHARFHHRLARLTRKGARQGLPPLLA